MKHFHVKSAILFVFFVVATGLTGWAGLSDNSDGAALLLIIAIPTALSALNRLIATFSEDEEIGI